MAKRTGMEVAVAVSEAVKMTKVDVVAAYPITPQSHIAEHLSDLVANGELDAEFIPVESEHSAMSACLGSSATGARTFTATAGPGLELMHEVLYAASGMRLPIVMAVTNRALSSPLSVWGDHSDVMSVRDTGWIQIFIENGQEAIDNILCAFRIAEDPRVLLPVMIHMDGFHISHMVEPVTFPEQSEVDAFLPAINFPLPLNPAKPVSMGDFAPPIIFTEIKWAQEINMEKSKAVVREIWQDFAKRFGRQYNPVETYRCEDCDTLLMTMGSYSETAMMAIDNLRAAGQKVGLVRFRLWRPFPFEEIRQITGKAKTLIVLDRSISVGMGGPVASEIRNALYPLEKKPVVVGFVGGLGGRDILPADFENIIKRGMEIAKSGSNREFEIYGVRE